MVAYHNLDKQNNVINIHIILKRNTKVKVFKTDQRQKEVMTEY